jgi:hypothetical protein
MFTTILQFLAAVSWTYRSKQLTRFGNPPQYLNLNKRIHQQECHLMDDRIEVQPRFTMPHTKVFADKLLRVSIERSMHQTIEISVSAANP